MAASNMLVCRLRFDENLLLNMITDHTKDRLMAHPHAAILMAGQPAEQLAL
jgi:flagellar transcriptional activator FlhD